MRAKDEICNRLFIFIGDRGNQPEDYLPDDSAEAIVDAVNRAVSQADSSEG